jgi:hypothetical protein
MRRRLRRAGSTAIQTMAMVWWRRREISLLKMIVVVA